MDKQQVAEQIVRIKVLQDALKNEMNVLRTHISTGEKIETQIGSIHMVDSNRTSYDEKGLYHELNKLGVDPDLVGSVVVKVDRKKFANAISEGKVPSSLVDEYSETKQVDALRIKPHTNAQGSNLEKEAMERVASILKG
jgi:hypothetical protein